MFNRNEEGVDVNGFSESLPVIQIPVTRRVAYFKSKTEEGKTYKVYRARTGKAFCQCPGFMFRQTCSHVERAKSWK